MNMTGQLNAVRRVRCPRCRALLAEQPDVPVYECGGCGAVLKAKNCKNDTKDTGSHVHETETTQKNKLEHVSDCKESQSLSQEEMLASKAELPLDKNCVCDPNEIQDNKREQSEDVKFSRVLSTGLTSYGNENSSPAVRAETEVDQGQCSLEQNNGGHQNEYGFCNKKQTDGLSFSNEVTCSTEPSHHENEEPSLLDGAYSEVAKEQDSGRNKNEYGYCNKKQPEGVCFSNELISSTEPDHHPSEVSSSVAGTSGELDLEEDNGRNQNRYGFCRGKQPQGVSFSDEVASSTEPDHHGSEESPVDGAYGELSLEQNNGRNQNRYGHCHGKEPLDASFSNELASSTELDHSESGESSLTDGAYVDVNLVQINGGNQNHYGCCYGKESLGVSFSNELASSTELNHHESEESLPVAGTYNVVDLEQKNVWNNEHGYCNWKQPRGVSFSDELASSSELNHHEKIKEPSLVAAAYNEMDFEQNNGRNQNEYGYNKGKQPGSVNFSNVIASSTELNHRENEELSPLAGAHHEVDENKDCLEQSSGWNQNEFGDFPRELPGLTKSSNEVSSCTELTCQEIEGLSSEVGTNAELDDNFNSQFVFRSLNVENLLSASPRDAIVTAPMPLAENIMADQMSPHSEELEQSQKRALNSFDRASSADTLDNVAFAKPSSKFSVILKDMPKSPTTRSYYARDSNLSSNDGTDDQARNCSSEKKHYSRKGSKWCQDELSESRKHGHPIRSRMKFETDDRLSRMPYYSRGCQVGYKNGRSSPYGQNEFQCSTSSRPPGKHEHLEPDEGKMELLKMVYELTDQLKRTIISEGKANGRFPGVSGVEKQIPSYYDRVAQEVEILHDLRNSRYSGRCNQVRRWPHHSRISQIPFSATISKHQVDCSCWPCCPEDWQYPAALPPHICCNKSQHIVQKRIYNLNHCGPSSSQHYTGSEFSLESTIHHEEKKYSRDKRQLAKRHVRPVAGGAPFIFCYGCSELLLLPVDFLLFKRRCHQLRCNACSVILKFSLENGTRLVPYTDTIAPPPPSEFDGRRNADNGGKLASVFHADPMSCSDDYGPSLDKSGSTEGEAFSVPIPFRTLRRNSSGRRVSASSSLEPVEERKKQPISGESQNKYKNPVKTFASRAGPSSNLSIAEKISSEIKELPPTATSSLHRLMGYSSLSKVLNGC